MLVDYRTFVGAQYGPLTNADISLAKQSLTYDADKYLSRQKARLIIAVLMIIASCSSVVLALEYFTLGFISVGLFFGGIFGLAFSVVPSCSWADRQAHHRLMQSFLNEDRVRVISADDPYFARVRRSIPNPEVMPVGERAWTLLAKEMINRTATGEVLNGILTLELMFDIVNESEGLVGDELEDFWNLRAAQFGDYIYQEYERCIDMQMA